MKIEKMIEIAKEEFKDHVAKFNQINEYTQEIEFQKPGTNYYSIRFLLSRDCLFVCGDLGEAVYQLTETATVDRIASGYDLSYLTEKLRTVTGGKYSFDSGKAINRIQEDLNGYDAEVKEFCEELITIAQACSSNEEWCMELVKREVELNEVICDWLAWLPCAGDQLDMSVVLYWVALKMAAKQLGYKVAFFN